MAKEEKQLNLYHPNELRGKVVKAVLADLEIGKEIYIFYPLHGLLCKDRIRDINEELVERQESGRLFIKNKNS